MITFYSTACPPDDTFKNTNFFLNQFNIDLEYHPKFFKKVTSKLAPKKYIFYLKSEGFKREVWDAETIFLALDVCDDSHLKLAINPSFACSM